MFIICSFKDLSDQKSLWVRKSRQNQFVSTIVLLFFVQVLIKLFNDTIREIIKQRLTGGQMSVRLKPAASRQTMMMFQNWTVQPKTGQVTTLVSALQV